MEDLDHTKMMSNDAIASRLLLAVLICFIAFIFSMLSELFGYHNNNETITNNHSQYYSIISVLLSIIIIPLTYYYGGNYIHNQREWNWFQPLKGGIRFVIFQALGWSFFALSFLLPAIPWIAAYFYPGLVLKGLTVAGGAAAVISQLLMISSLLSYKKPSATRNKENDNYDGDVSDNADNTSDNDNNNNSNNNNRAHARIVNQRFSHLHTFVHSDSGKIWWKSFLGIQVALVFVGCCVAVVADLLMTEHGMQWIGACFSLSCVAIGVGVTHGVGGSWRYFQDQWSFFLPGGSYIFLLLQSIGWFFFVISALIFILQIFQFNDAPQLVTAGVSGLLAEVLLAGSLVTRGDAVRSIGRNDTFKEHKDNNDNKKDTSQDNLDNSITEVSYSKSFTHYSNGVSLLTVVLRTALVTFIYNTQNLVFFSVVIAVVLADVFPVTVVTLWILGILIYPWTFTGTPMTKGTRSVKWFQGHWLFKHIAAYFDLKIIYDDVSPLPSEGKRYIFGFHPHGIIPLTIGWACLSDLWQKIFPNIQPAALASSVLHVVPFTRDLAQMFGGYAVTRTGFLAALKREKSVVFIPGGQHEMIHSSSKSDHVVLNSRHRGFIKVSLQTGSSLVPVFSFGEKNIFDNFPTPITWQLRAMKALRANIFFLPYGQFLMSIPRQTRIRLAVGKPIHVPVVANPSDELINILRDHYFTELLNLIEKLKKKCDSPNTKVEVRPQVSTVTKQDWFEKLKQLEKNVYQKDGPNIDVVQHDDPLLTMKLNHVSWTNEVTFCAAFFILAFAVIVQRSGLFW